MRNTYFDYVLSQCRTQEISSICGVVSTRKALIEKAKSEFNGCNNIIADQRFFETVKVCLGNYEIINPNILSQDAFEVYCKCKTFAYSVENFNYDSCFDMLVDFNWLQASIQDSKSEGSRTIDLLSNPTRIRSALRVYLLGIYNVAIQDSNECVFIDEAIKARGKLFMGVFPFQHEESRRYASSNLLLSDLRSLQQARRTNSHKGMSLFFGLTATAALTENIRKGLF